MCIRDSCGNAARLNRCILGCAGELFARPAVLSPYPEEDTFSGKYGLINSRANTSAFSQDSSFSLLSALEIIGEDGELERKADMFSKRTIKPHTPVTSVAVSYTHLDVYKRQLQ